MSLSAALDEMRRNVEKVRQEQGDAAAEQFEKEQRAGFVGGSIGMNGGALAGALVGSAIFPGVGTLIGGVIGGFVGLTSGVNDKSTADNVRTAWGVASSLGGGLRK